MRIRLTLDIERRRAPEPEGELERDTAVDALVERSELHPRPPFGFAPNMEPEDRR